jgi:hypothetical protein
MDAEIVVAWPRLLDDRIRLLLVLQVTITGSQTNVTEAPIRAYDFRTRLRGEKRRLERVVASLEELRDGVTAESGRKQTARQKNTEGSVASAS